jgi:hypothetical protein
LEEVIKMPVTVGNIIVGAANFFEGDTSSLRDLGATVGGVALALGGNDFVRIEIDQMRGIADIEQVLQNYLVRTTLSEPTLANLAAAYNKPEASIASDVFSVEDDVRDQRRVVFVGPAPGTNKKRSFSTDQAVFVGTPEHTYQRGEATVLAVELEIVPQARTWTQSLNVGAAINSRYVQINSIFSGDNLVKADKLIGGILAVVTGTGIGQSRAITDSTTVTSGAPGSGTLTIDPAFVTTPVLNDVITVQANRAALWATIRDV